MLLILLQRYWHCRVQVALFNLGLPARTLGGKLTCSESTCHLLVSVCGELQMPPCGVGGWLKKNRAENLHGKFQICLCSCFWSFSLTWLLVPDSSHKRSGGGRPSLVTPSAPTHVMSNTNYIFDVNNYRCFLNLKHVKASFFFNLKIY